MKHSAGRKTLRMQIRSNRRAEGRKKAKWNDWMNSHPNDSRLKKQVSNEHV